MLGVFRLFTFLWGGSGQSEPSPVAYPKANTNTVISSSDNERPQQPRKEEDLYVVCVCVCVCVWTLLSPHYINICMRIRTMCVCVCVCADFHCFLGASLQFCLQCGAAEGGDGGGRYVGYGPGWNTLSSAMNECRLNNCLVRQQSHSKGD